MKKILTDTFEIVRDINATVWGCTVAAGQGLQAGAKFIINKL